MASATGASLEEIKLAIKKWEYEFRNTYGRVPSKTDIREHPEIDAQYKRYKVLKSGGKENTEGPRTPQKRKYQQHHNRTIATTPSPRRRHHTTTVPQSSPSPRKTFSPSSPHTRRGAPLFPLTVIGPTPQADGKVLCIADILSAGRTEESPFYRSPLAARGRSYMLTTGGAESPPPERPRSSSSSPLFSSHSTNGVPGSDTSPPALTTPTRPALSFTASHQQTPPSASAYFRNRVSSRSVYLTPSPIKRMTRPPVARGLSVILAELRQEQDEMYAEEEEIMRELELAQEAKMGSMTSPCGQEAKTTEGKMADASEAVPMQSPDEQEMQEMTAPRTGEYHLGEIQETDVERCVREGETRERETLKAMRPAKNKRPMTQKRSKRRYILRPVGNAPDKADDNNNNNDSNGEDDEEVQTSFDDVDGHDDDPDSATDEDNAFDGVAPPTHRMPSPLSSPPAKVSTRAGGVSHNFKRLKMRSSKGAQKRPGNGRFGRRR
ncbi:DNA replication/checkpoint protein [Limtongia smithiae]|uniref:DNA replication/checkpoint protein n=1 Tax=Limtongia smithiae TaxID=1125753 RepID=UPI0034CE6218